VPDYDPLTISAEDLKALPPAERAAVYKARAAAARGGAAPAPAAASAAPKAETPTQQAPAAGAPSGTATPAATSAGTAAPAATSAGTAPPAASSAGTGAPAATSAGAAPSGTTSQAPATSEPASRTATPAQPAAPARPAAPAPPKEPEKPAEPPFVQHVLQAVDGSSFQWRHGYAELKVPRERLLDTARLLRSEGFDYLSFITEVDWQQHLELIYHLFSYDYRTQPLGAIVRCELPRDGVPEVASLTSVWRGAEFMEREAFEMMGINFLGHPDLRRILLPDDFVGFPMRRDFETDWDYVTVKQLVHESD
jgi:NADH-quinone oxidoreductase subunit C